MTDKPTKPKRTRKPKVGPKPITRLVQGRLSTIRPDKDIQQREIDAIKFLDHLRSKEKMTDRELITEALLIMRTQWDEGYTPPQSVKLTHQMQEALAMILDHIRMLSTLDLSSLRSQPAWNEDHFQKTSSRLHESAADFLGQSKNYDYYEDES